MQVTRDDMTKDGQDPAVLANDPLAGLATAFGKSFLDKFVEGVALALDAEMVTIGAFKVLNSERIEVFASSFEENDRALFEYETQVAPCHDVVMTGLPQIIGSDVQELYPNDEFFIIHDFHSYVGYPLKNQAGETIGLVQASWKRAVDKQRCEQALSYFETFCTRISHELTTLTSFALMRSLIVDTRSLNNTTVFRSLAEHLQAALSVKTAFIAECSEEDPGQLRLLAYCLGGTCIPEVEGRELSYDETPCGLLLDRKTAMIQSGLQQLFPHQASFQELGRESYLGVALNDRDGKMIGHIAFQNDRGMSPRLMETDLVELLANRVEIEMQRYMADFSRREAEAALLVKQKNESLGLLAGSISHDFNNLLGSMVGQAELALENAGKDNPVRPNLEIISACLESSSELVGHLLNYAKGTPNTAHEVVDINDVVQDVIRLLPIEKSHREFTLDLAEAGAGIKGDRGQLSQMVMNLIFNAVDAMAGFDGQISIRTHREALTEEDLQYFTLNTDALGEGDCILLEITDCGQGMSEETATRVFDPYFTTKETGKGLGMAAVVGITKRHHGAISMETEEGEGTHFVIAFPATDEVAEVVNAPVVETAAPPKQNGQQRILVVDDEPVFRKTVEALLRADGYFIAAVDGYSAALAMMQDDGPFDCALIDVTMPEENGWKTLLDLRTLQPDLTCIMMSGFSISPKEAGHPELEGIPLLDKPFRRSTLMTALDEALA
jgi:signal transduction histidine kinase